MLNGILLLLSTPADVVRRNRFTDLGVASIRFLTAIKSVCSGPLSPFHLQSKKVPVRESTT